MRWDVTQSCDACDRAATRTLSAETSDHCAFWFICHYCDRCWKAVESVMRETTQEENR